MSQLWLKRSIKRCANCKIDTFANIDPSATIISFYFAIITNISSDLHIQPHLCSLNASSLDWCIK